MLHSAGSFVLSAARFDVCTKEEFTMLRKEKKVITLGEKMHFEKSCVDLNFEEQGSFSSILLSKAKFLLSDWAVDFT